jgi:type VI secretion system protein VasG
VGSDTIMQLSSKPDRPGPEKIRDAIRPELLNAFPAALLGRMVVIPYYPLSDAMLGSIVELQLGRISKRVRERYSVPFQYDPSVVQLITKRCTEVESGGRMIDAVLTNTLLPEISRELLLRTLDNRPIQLVKVSAKDDTFEYAFE